MAKINIFPLAIDGVSSPLNLLYKLFTNGVKPNLTYPLDLASNPNYGHAVQFQIYESTYESAQYAQDVLTGGKKATGADIIGMLQGSAHYLKATQNSLASISLYMPDSLTNSYTHDWSQISLKDTLGLGSFLASAIAEYNQIGGKDAPDTSRSNFLNFWAKGMAGGAASAISGKLGTGSDLGALVQNELRMLPNPQLQMLYKGIELREFQFEFVFTPSSKKEAQAVESIIQTFTYYSVPALVNGGNTNSTQFLRPPELFDIQFLFTGGTGLSNTVMNFFKNIGTNILSSQVYGALFGSSPNLSNAKQAKVFKIYHPCVLTGMSVDYGPNGWVSYDDGYPLQITMSLSFKETDIVTKENVDQQKYKNEYVYTYKANPNEFIGPIQSNGVVTYPVGPGGLSGEV